MSSLLWLFQAGAVLCDDAQRIQYCVELESAVYTNQSDHKRGVTIFDCCSVDLPVFFMCEEGVESESMTYKSVATWIGFYVLSLFFMFTMYNKRSCTVVDRLFSGIFDTYMMEGLYKSRQKWHAHG